jgi:DNA-binding transcriptional MocR family regulator
LSKQSIVERVNITWRRVLALKFKPSDLKDVVIANAIKNAVLNKTLVLDSYVPPYRVVAQYMGLNRSVLSAAWQRLAVEHKLFKGHKGGGTKIVDELPDATEKVKIADPLMTGAGFKYRFDLETTAAIYSGTVKLNKEMERISKSIPKLDVKQLRQLDIPGLTKQFRILINNNISAYYSDNQIYYAQGIPQLIYRICMALSPSKKIFLMGKPAPLNVINAIQNSGKQVRFIETDEYGLKLDQLEKMCKKHLVAFVYVKSRCERPGRGRMSEERISGLLALQVKYKFIIIEDDCNVDFYLLQPNLLMDKVNGTEAKVLYLSPVTAIQPELCLMCIMAGPEKLVEAVMKKFSFAGKLSTITMGLVLKEVMKKQILQKIALKMKKSLPELYDTAFKVLKESNMWENKGISPEVGWYFFLKPIHGRFPADAYRRLITNGFIIADPADYENDYPITQGMMISVAGYLDNNRLVPDLQHLIKFLKTIIITN